MTGPTERRARLDRRLARMHKISDACDKATEGERVVLVGQVRAVYELAHIDSGWYYVADLRTNFQGSYYGWHGPEETREDALQAALARFRESCLSIAETKHNSDWEDAARTVQVLQEGLFGFAEPDPLPAGTSWIFAPLDELRRALNDQVRR